MPRIDKNTKHPRVTLNREDARWVAAAASFNDETPKGYIERVLLPIANAIVESGEAVAKPWVPSPPATPPRSFSISTSEFHLLVDAAAIEGLTIKRFAEKHLVPVARKEVIAEVRKSQKKAA